MVSEIKAKWKHNISVTATRRTCSVRRRQDHLLGIRSSYALQSVDSSDYLPQEEYIPTKADAVNYRILFSCTTTAIAPAKTICTAAACTRGRRGVLEAPVKYELGERILL
jgi:hypothetical protein